MEPVMLVEVLDEHGNTHQRLRVATPGMQCRIGRSLACDIALDDAHAAPMHVLLTLQADGRVHVRDLETRNGTRVDGRRINVQHGRVMDGGELRVGRTRIRVRTAGEPLAPERLFRRDLLQRHRSAFATGSVALCLAFAALMAWARYPENAAQNMLLAVLLAIALLAIWAGAWALVSRLSVGAWQLRIHLALAATCLALWAWGYWLQALAAFALQWRWLGSFMIALAGLVGFIAAWRHLRYATRMRRAAAMSLALLAPLLGGGLWWLVDLQLDPRTVNRVQLGARIQPAALRLAPSVDLADYLTDAATLKREANRNRQQSLLEAPILDEED